MEPYKFTYDGHEILFQRATVRTGIEAREIVIKLLRSHGFVDGNIAPDSEYRLFDEFGSVMSRTKTDAPWWVHSNMSEEETREKFDSFMELDEALYVEFRNANAATKPLKKTPTLTPEI